MIKSINPKQHSRWLGLWRARGTDQQEESVPDSQPDKAASGMQRKRRFKE